MQRFKSDGQAQRFLSAHAMIYGHFRPRRHLMPRPPIAELALSSTAWRAEATCAGII
jgi:putative transposase